MKTSYTAMDSLILDSLILDSLMLALKLTYMCKSNKELIRITGKAWCRHWRRVQKAINAGEIAYEIPTDALKDCI
jgi:hypothetical protein